MKNALFALLLLSGIAWGQGSNKPTIIPYPGAPTGACSPAQLAVNSATGDFYDCVAGVWTKVGSSGGGTGTVTQTNPATDAGTATNLGTFGFSSQTTTPTLTFNLTTAGAHKYWGNNTGSTAAPNYLTIALADLPGSLVTATSPGAGVAHFAGSTQSVTSSAVVAADTDTSIAHTGVDVNTSYQVTATHLASALPVGQGGTGITSGTANKVLGGATPSMVTITSGYVDNSIALTGTDINTSNQVTVTHLAAALPVNQGGTGTTSTLTGLMRGNASAMTAAELSGDCTTSGSNAITCVQLNGTNFTVNSSGVVTKADGVTTAGGPGVPVVVYNTGTSVTMTSGTSQNITSVSMITPGADGQYQVQATVSTTAAGSGGTCAAGTVALRVGYTDRDSGQAVVSAAGTSNLQTLNITNTTATNPTITSSLATFRTTATAIQAKSGTAIVFYIDEGTASNCTTPPVLELRPTLIWVGN